MLSPTPHPSTLTPRKGKATNTYAALTWGQKLCEQSVVETPEDPSGVPGEPQVSNDLAPLFPECCKAQGPSENPGREAICPRVHRLPPHLCPPTEWPLNTRIQWPPGSLPFLHTMCTTSCPLRPLQSLCQPCPFAECHLLRKELLRCI